MMINAAIAVPRVHDGLSSLAFETRRVLDWHEKAQRRTLRGLSMFAGALVLALAIALLLLGASAVQAAGLI